MASIIAYSGIVTLRRRDLERLKAAGERVHIRMTGLLVIGRDVCPSLAGETIGRLDMKGYIHAPAAVKRVLQGKRAA